MAYKTTASTLATALTVAAYLPYLRSITRGQVRPHMFTWIIWGTVTLLAFIATLQAGGGKGAWVLGLSAGVSFLVAKLAHVKRADVSVTRLDGAFLVAAFAAIPLWLLARDPLWAVCLLTLIELLGFGPTFRKTWHAPSSESASFLGILIVRNALILAALESYAVVTVLFPAVAAIACLALLAMMLWRRRALAL